MIDNEQIANRSIIRLGIVGPAKGPGQLGMLLALAANRVFCTGEKNILIHTIGSEPSPEWSDAHFGVSLEEMEAFYKQSDLITFETESIDEAFQENFARKLLPSIEALKIFQNRLAEKNSFNELGLKTAEFYLIDEQTDWNQLISELQRRKISTARLKTLKNGYDGLGQVKINDIAELKDAWYQLNQRACLLEEEITIYRELSIISNRQYNGEVIHFAIPQNEHRNGVLYRSRSAAISTKLQNKLESINENLLSKLNYVGTFTLEVFQTGHSGGIIVLNEAAPRVHNSGHYTLDACENVNQFDAHIRAICALPICKPELKLPYFSMTNLLGLSQSHFLALKTKLERSDLFVDPSHLSIYWYNKGQPRPGRKMGHITVLADNFEHLEEAEALIDSSIEQLEV